MAADEMQTLAAAMNPYAKLSGGIEFMEHKRPFLLGLIGGVGAGKSTVLSFLEKHYHFHVIQTDLTARRLLEPGEAAYEKVVSLLGPGVLGPDGSIDRTAMAGMIFKDPTKRQAVNAITHPLTWKAVLEEAYACKKCPVVIETALPSKEFRDKCDEMWYLYTSEENRTDRLMESRGYSEEKARAIMESQAADQEFRDLADAVIDNNGSPEHTKYQVKALLKGREGIRYT